MPWICFILGRLYKDWLVWLTRLEVENENILMLMGLFAFAAFSFPLCS